MVISVPETPSSAPPAQQPVVADSFLEIRGVHKRFGGRKGEPEVHALADVSLQVPHGSLVALVGPDGAGKTTLLRLAAALMPADGGTLRVLGLDPAAQSQQVFPGTSPTNLRLV